MKLHYSTESVVNSRVRKIKAVIKATGVEVADAPHETNADIAKLSVFKILPVLETKEGNLFSSNTIVRYLATIGGKKLYGGDNLHHTAQIDQWLDVSACEFDAATSAIVAAKDAKEVDTTSVTEDIQKLLKVYEQTLNGKKFLVGDNVSIADISLAANLAVVFSVMLGEQERKQYPNLTAWYLSMVDFDGNLGPKDLPKEGHKAFQAKEDKKKGDNKKGDNKKGDNKKGNKKEEGDDLFDDAPKKAEGDDLFDDNDDTAAAKPSAPKVKKEAKKEEGKKDKAKPAAKSIVIFDVKVYDQETDLNAVAKKIKEEIVIDGLVWNNQPKIVPVAYGMNKLQMGCVVEDAKVSVEDFYEKIEEWEEIQSIDTVSFQKL